eukprot:gene6738-8354_t
MSMKCIEKVIVALGSENKAKIRAAEIALSQVFKDKEIQVLKCSVPSLVSAQPMDDDETITGAINRAKNALQFHPTAQFGIGMEGGIHQITSINKWFECGWIAIVDKQGNIGLSSTARFELPQGVISKIVNEKKELAEIMDELTGKSDIRSNEGAMGVFTNSLLHRDYIYSHAVIFAFSRFVVNPDYWK